MTGLSRPLNPLTFSVSDQWLDEYTPGEKRCLIIDVDVYELPSMKFLGHARDEGHRSHPVVKHAKLCTDFLLFYQVAQPCPARVKATFVYHQAPPSP